MSLVQLTAIVKTSDSPMTSSISLTNSENSRTKSGSATSHKLRTGPNNSNVPIRLSAESLVLTFLNARSKELFHCQGSKVQSRVNQRKDLIFCLWMIQESVYLFLYVFSYHCFICRCISVPGGNVILDYYRYLVLFKCWGL